ncbi:type III secretion inner membrane ring lipoprotein SctJ [Roseateles sp. SL47]|uniref:type III secretion system inner membrane ring lipoprotein SctJ n=1 Tax=Roseateles sp. SL47 TaxID=2995138 RepID=UPI00226DE4DC|nr:type III secretion inner membrane ring lipoprotein SctJ [Roseateles sp. SL47]WAC74590.1 type III secretion inner membrane ring lipoprotein SctJ [Roseateles sp. SL47]
MKTLWIRDLLPSARGLVTLLMVLPLVLLTGCRTEVDLHSGLADSEANRVVTALRDDGIAAQKRSTKEGVVVSVPESDLARATAVLQARGLPHRAAARMGDVFKKEGLISSPLEERARYVYALSQELEATLAEIDGVVVARVHVVLPEKVAPGEPVQPPTAAVFIKHLPSLEPDVIGLRVRQLVARSIPGMGAQAVDRVSAVFVVSDGVPKRPLPPPTSTSWVWTALGGLMALLVLVGAGLVLREARRRRDAALEDEGNDDDVDDAPVSEAPSPQPGDGPSPSTQLSGA